ncbi:protein ssh4 [Phtheirospermum japonicum]|uniref:Protein ssh4 n=1 Tax=Phtheirospermum japonicum TaxID=374723 RepID=A0A830CXA8_9LAMI|nr:protein ssh4 [Phtheirospermum japonicum]
MAKWSHIIPPVAICAVILAFILVTILKRCFRPKNIVSSEMERVQSLQNGIARLHQVSPLHHHHHHHHMDRESSKKTANYYLFRRGVLTKNPSFCWADHPSLVTDAVENGWSRFAFTTIVSSSPSMSVKSAKALFGACATGNEKTNLEISWEVCQGSADFMQKIRLNPGLKKTDNNMSVARAALPLPGPNLGINSSFPQESYFEITVLSCNENDARDQLEDKEKREKTDCDKIKLIGENLNVKNDTDSLSFVCSCDSVTRTKMDDLKQGASVSMGLTRGGSLALRIPGTYPGSIAFNSTGSVYLDGTKLVFESKSNEWGISNKVIGCGYNPSQKKVFFTVNAQLVHEIHCKTQDFTSPLYPTIAANDEITILVNLGQSPFKFAPANLQRTSNPCFIGPLGTSPTLGYEDSRELFSMGRIDSQWLHRSANRSHNNTVNGVKALEYDLESDGDLFEIVLESSGRSPYGTIHHQL